MEWAIAINLEGIYKRLSAIACWNLVRFCLAVPETLDREIWKKYFTKWRLAGERNKPMMSNLVWEHLSSSSTSGPNLVIIAQTVFKRSQCRDDDGVLGLCHKRLRQLRWARALKILTKFFDYIRMLYFFIKTKFHGQLFMQPPIAQLICVSVVAFWYLYACFKLTL